MEPLLELVDRMTATIWVFVKYMPPKSKREGNGGRPSTDSVPRSLRDATERLRKVAERDYAKLQELLDIYKPHDPSKDYSKDPLAWVVTGISQTLGTRLKRALQKLWRPVRVTSQKLWMDLKNLFTRKQAKGPDENHSDGDRDDSGEDRDHRYEAVRKVLEALTLRIQALERIWEEARLRDPTFSEQTLLEYCTTIDSDQLFDRLAKWISCASLTLEDRKELAENFVPVSLGKTPESRTRFLLESSLNFRAKELYSQDRRLQFRRQRLATSQKSRPEDTAAEWLALEVHQRLNVLLDRDRLRSICRDMDVAVPFSLVFSDELEQIARARELRLNPDPTLYANECSWRKADSGPAELQDSSQHGGICDAPQSQRFPDQIAFDSCLFGLALSGGGIRSATFSLGLMQAMADRNILPYIDIISSVSGGGYLSSFLVAWIKRRGGIHSVQESLRGYAAKQGCETPVGLHFPTPDETLPPNQDPRADHLRPVRLLREYARYLAPEEGLFSADTWTMAATWLRNTFLNLMVLILLFAGLLLVPRVAVIAMHLMRVMWETFGTLHLVRVIWNMFGTSNLGALKASLFGGIPFLPICVVIGAWNLQAIGLYEQPSPRLTRGWSDGHVVPYIVLPLLLAGAFYTSAIWNSHALASPFQMALGFGAICFVGPFLMMLSCVRWVKLIDNKSAVASLSLFALLSFCAVFTGLVGFLLMYGFSHVLKDFGINTMRGIWIAASVGPPVMMIITATAVVCMVGLAGTLLSDAQREWWSRLGAWLSIATFAWLAISSISFFSPLWIAMAGIKSSAWVGGLTWSAITAAGLKIAFSPQSANSETDKSKLNWKSWILNAAPIVFVVGLLCVTSFLVFRGSLALLDFTPASIRPFEHPESNALCCTQQPMGLQRIAVHYWPLLNPRSAVLLIVAALLLILSRALASRVNVNTFSMHHFYRNRLVRAYLGASRQRAHREPNAFTGFDPEDDIRLHRFIVDDESEVHDRVTDCQRSYRGPFPIINTALNVTKGQDLGIQQRRAESFIFTPLWSGFDYMRKQTLVRESASLEFAFRQTKFFGDQMNSGTNQGAHLGTAMAISGAAFSSNAGFHTSPPLAFLLTVFGVRLGWWAGNPRKTTWSKGSPPESLTYLACELTANTTVDRDFVLLTDGGHFENMGLYELVRRRCQFIIVCDAEQDEKFKLEGIGGAVRKCRSDFGVVIDLNLDVLKPLGDPATSMLHFSVGTVRYPGHDKCGKLVYIKASLTGDESVDLIEFGQRHPEFPHTPTINQMFDESHFESYRELGHHVGSTVFQKNWKSTENIKSEEEFCGEVCANFATIAFDWEDLRKQAELRNRDKVRTCIPTATSGVKQ
jgi:hypothetical protein